MRWFKYRLIDHRYGFLFIESCLYDKIDSGQLGKTNPDPRTIPFYKSSQLSTRFIKFLLSTRWVDINSWKHVHCAMSESETTSGWNWKVYKGRRDDEAGSRAARWHSHFHFLGTGL